ncbi:hypothetical protein K474DRAFT_1359873 [Panus rudis PR-1116 ss-1]|nr:hypothetical protein K474DRAFT_1359873 [Panus rudis PR-1116 ss-1]
MSEEQYEKYRRVMSEWKAKLAKPDMAPDGSHPHPPYTSLYLDVHRIHQGSIAHEHTTVYEFPHFMDVRCPMPNQSFFVAWQKPNSARMRRAGKQTELSPTDAMIHFTIAYDYDSSSRFRFVFPLTTFIKPGASLPSSRRVHPWSQWGPQNTHFSQFGRLARMVHVSGYHAICPSGEVIDFNPYTIAMLSQYNTSLPPDRRPSPYKDLPADAKVVLPDNSSMRDTDVFWRPIQSSLPYMVQPAPALESYYSDGSWSRELARKFFVQDGEEIKVRKHTIPPFVSHLCLQLRRILRR